MGNKRSKSSYSTQVDISSPPLFGGGVLDIAYQNDQVICCSDDKSICIFDWKETLSNFPASEKNYLKGHTGAVNRICVRNHIVFSASRDLSTRIWDLSNLMEKSCVEKAHSLNVSAITALSNGSQFVSGSRDYSVKIRDTETCELLREYSSPRNVVTCLKYDSHDNLLYQGSEDLCFRVWDTRSQSNQPVTQLSGYLYFPISVDISGNYLVSGSKGFNTTGGGEVRVWDLRMGCVVRENRGHVHDVTACRFAGDEVVVSASKDGSICCWNIHSEVQPLSFPLADTTLLTSLDVLKQDDRVINVTVGSFDGSVSFLRINDYATTQAQPLVLMSSPCVVKSDPYNHVTE